MDPENQELLVFNTPTSEVPPKNGFCDPRDLVSSFNTQTFRKPMIIQEGSLLNNMIESEFVEEPKVGWNYFFKVYGQKNFLDRSRSTNDARFEPEQLSKSSC